MADVLDCVAGEIEQPENHAFFNGKVFAMAGVSGSHATQPGNLFMTLRNHPRGGAFSFLILDMKLQVEPDNAFCCPDVFATCVESDRSHSTYKAAPRPAVADDLRPTLTELPDTSTIRRSIRSFFLRLRRDNELQTLCNVIWPQAKDLTHA